jgi:peptide-methionine (S)-S-oxide reductase
VISELSEQRVFDDPIVTEVLPAGIFHVAEGYHQEYFQRNPQQPYCQFVVAPKVAKFRKTFLDRLKR